jgi:hypothetical protein
MIKYGNYFKNFIMPILRVHDKLSWISGFSQICVAKAGIVVVNSLSTG